MGCNLLKDVQVRVRFMAWSHVYHVNKDSNNGNPGKFVDTMVGLVVRLSITLSSPW
eukprot:CAMPEP_0178747708 /NCGR_PEP_ID=MMETSP0744-20121128/8468_1 /TAXON_ID=913974 /ORGANISM="Nitzschia punctata, Strain CCMP561" /LENGTH=55 /DNA_ID=CAMNT_0020400967 /DNA_START=474 /DNA_END=638 /DNA_ORIENTATION=-